MANQENMSQRWENYRPSKALWIWSCIGVAVATMIIGFTAGGWVTGGTANAMADEAAESATAELVATLCVNRFVEASGAANRLVALKEADSWDRDGMVEEGGWVQLTGMDEPVSGSADLCADKLVALEDLPAREVETGTAIPETTDG